MEKVYVFAWVCAHVLWGFECACGGQRSTSYIFLDQSSSYYLTRGLSLSLGPIDLARLADQRAPGERATALVSSCSEVASNKINRAEIEWLPGLFFCCLL